MAVNLAQGDLDICAVAFNSAISAEWGERLARGKPQYSGPLSTQQQAIADAFMTTDHHIIIAALAGCSKSTTAERLMYLQPANRFSMTTHKLGKQAVDSAMGRPKIDKWKVWSIVDTLTSPAIQARRDYKHLTSVIVKLVGLLKSGLMQPTDDNIDALIAHHAIDLTTRFTSESGDDTTDAQLLVTEFALKAYQCSIDEDRTIDFDDMLFYPVHHNLIMRKYDVVIGDETQDWNALQQALVLKSARRLVLVGDENQAIYGFRGADVHAMDNMTDKLSATDRGCIVLPLTVTRRCPTSIVALAQQLVPTFEAAEDAPAGTIMSVPTMQSPEPGDMVLCRTNAPLIKGAYSCLAAGIPARIQGRDFGQGLKRFIEKLANVQSTCDQLSEALDRYYAKELEKLMKQKRSDEKIDQLEGQVECIRALMTGQTTVAGVFGMIDSLFEDTKPSSDIVLFSSVHRAKGLESNVVRILEPQLMPHPMARNEWQQRQERNILYVAITRAIKTLKFHGQPGGVVLPATGNAPDDDYGDNYLESADDADYQEVLCHVCHGTGDHPSGDATNCSRCGGTGIIHQFEVK